MDQAAGASVAIREQFELLEKLGKGSYGVVQKARHRQSNEMRALKKITYDKDGSVPSTTIREIYLLRKMAGHDNIVRLHDFVYDEKCIYVVMEYLDRDLRNHMKLSRNEFKNRKIVKHFLHQILKGIAHCHSCRPYPVIHRDLKPQNLLINPDTKQLKLADFGLAREIGFSRRTYTHEVVTRRYRASEILLGARHYCTPVDVWSIGCIFAEMVNQNALFDGDTEISMLFSIFSILGTPTEETWPGIASLRDYNSTTTALPKWPKWQPQDLALEVPTLEPAGIDLLSKMLCLDPGRRISAHAALEHEYFDDLEVA